MSCQNILKICQQLKFLETMIRWCWKYNPVHAEAAKPRPWLLQLSFFLHGKLLVGFHIDDVIPQANQHPTSIILSQAGHLQSQSASAAWKLSCHPRKWPVFHSPSMGQPSPKRGQCMAWGATSHTHFANWLLTKNIRGLSQQVKLLRTPENWTLIFLMFPIGK